jgi:hypothetical protein
LNIKNPQWIYHNDYTPSASYPSTIRSQELTIARCGRAFLWWVAKDGERSRFLVRPCPATYEELLQSTIAVEPFYGQAHLWRLKATTEAGPTLAACISQVGGLTDEILVPSMDQWVDHPALTFYGKNAAKSIGYFDNIPFIKSMAQMCHEEGQEPDLTATYLYIFQSSLLPCRRQSCSTWSCWLDGRWALVCCSHAYQVQTLLAPNQWHIRIAKHATSAGRMTSLIVAQSSRNLANNMYAQLRKYSLRATKPKQYDISSTQDQSSESDTHSFDGTWGAHMQWSWCNCTWRERSLLYISCTHSSIWISFLPILESLVVSAILCELLL